MLREIEGALEEYGLPIFYGLVTEDDDLPVWNYFVHNRKELRKTNKLDFAQYYEVHLVHEEYVPEEMVLDVIKKVETLPGVRLADIPVTYNYASKGSTGLAVEIATITFASPFKR